ncbi:hypothetical protein P9112_012199 [Eukaryota sp. TZLM1-RC]
MKVQRKGIKEKIFQNSQSLYNGVKRTLIALLQTISVRMNPNSQSVQDVISAADRLLTSLRSSQLSYPSKVEPTAAPPRLVSQLIDSLTSANDFINSYRDSLAPCIEHPENLPIPFPLSLPPQHLVSSVEEGAGFSELCNITYSLFKSVTFLKFTTDAKLSALSRCNKKTQNENSSLKTQIRELNEALDEKDKEKRHLESVHQSSRREIKHEVTELRNLYENHLYKLKQQLEQTQLENSELVNNIAESERVRRSLESDVAKGHKEIDSLRRELSFNEQTRAQLSKEVNLLRSKLASLNIDPNEDFSFGEEDLSKSSLCEHFSRHGLDL